MKTCICNHNHNEQKQNNQPIPMPSFQLIEEKNKQEEQNL